MWCFATLLYKRKNFLSKPGFWDCRSAGINCLPDGTLSVSRSLIAKRLRVATTFCSMTIIVRMRSRNVWIWSGSTTQPLTFLSLNFPIKIRSHSPVLSNYNPRKICCQLLARMTDESDEPLQEQQDKQQTSSREALAKMLAKRTRMKAKDRVVSLILLFQTRPYKFLTGCS